MLQIIYSCITCNTDYIIIMKILNVSTYYIITKKYFNFNLKFQMNKGPHMNKKTIISLIFNATGIILIIILLMVLLISKKNIIITDNHNSKYQCKRLVVIGKSAISFNTSQNAADIDNNFIEKKFFIKIFRLNDLHSITFPEEELTDELTNIQNDGATPVYRGIYNIKANGHLGILYIYEKDNRLRGTLRFPQWANGVTEYLKGVSIKGNSIKFKRSAKSIEELQRIGTNSYYEQDYTGFFSNNGRTIKGSYFSNGVKNVWEGTKK